MVENSKHVRVDNWGVFFLQRLQMFFSKTDFCDLTLQFDGNVQLKVHRLVMNACTEYFQYLESCQSLEESVILMPEDLQADVIVPIVNFMYTGTLQFQISQFEKLYKAAEIMNITVLTKLLDAQKYAVTNTKAAGKKNFGSQQQSTKKSTPKVTAPNIDLPATLPGRKLPVWKRKNAPSTVPVLSPPSQTQSRILFSEKRCVSTSSDDPLFVHDNAPKPTRFEWPEEDLPNLSIMDTSFEDISYTSKPLLTVDYEFKAGPSFDDVKYSGHNKPVPVSNKKQSKPKLDMEEMKDYVKEQKIRSGLANYDEDEPYEPPKESMKRKLESKSQEGSPSKKVKVGEKQIVHTKIISEILKKYPQLVKKNKNIRLKIMAKSPKATSNENKQGEKMVTNSKIKLHPSSSTKKEFAKTGLVSKEGNTVKPSEIWTCDRCSTSEEPVEFVLYYLYRKHMTDVHYEKFDPLLCKYCGQYCKSHLSLTYHLYTKHAIKPASTKAFLQCDLCPFIALTEDSMKKHRGNHSPTERRCADCRLTFTNKTTLTSHIQITGHTGKSTKKNFDCQYCIKKFPSSINLFSHLRLQHRMEANSDGIVSINENEELEESEEQDGTEKDEYILPEMMTESTSKDKVKIISNVKVSQDSSHPGHQQVTLEPSSESEALNNVASGIATSLGLVDIVVLDENQQYILQSNNQQLITQEGQQEFILPDMQDNTQYVPTSSAHSVMSQDILPSGDISSTDELVMVLTDHDYKDGQAEISNDNSNIVVLYSHPVDGQQGQFITSQGNLMVNSQTGLIEIRNGATITTTASSGQLVVTDSQDSHIESIEMIQREIESHNGMKHDTNEDIKAVGQTSHNMVPCSEQVVTAITSQSSTVISTHSDTVVMSTTPSESDVDHIVKPNENLSDIQNAAILQSTEETEIHEQITESVHNQSAEGETSIDSSLIEEQLQKHTDDACIAVQDNVEEQETQLNEPQEGDESIEQHLQENNITEQEQGDEEPINEANDEVEGLDTIDSSQLSQASAADENMEVDECSDSDRLMECENSFEQENIKSAEEIQIIPADSRVQDDMPELSAEANKNDESQDVPPDLDRSPPTLEIEESKSSSEVINPEEGPPKLQPVEQATHSEQQHETELMDVDEQAEEAPVEQVQGVDDVDQEVDEVDQGVDTGDDQTNEAYGETDNTLQGISKLEEGTYDTEKEVGDGERIEIRAPEKLEDLSSEKVEHLVPDSQQDSLSREDAETLADVSTDQADVNTESQEDCQQSETSTSQFNDENSQSSQESRISEQIDDESKKAGDANEATKISILNDWEDTDSQQSGDRNEAIKVAGETVNKLMDEWEEEEDADE